LPGGLIFDLTGERYARDWALPQFYFHLMTAYAILEKLRASGEGWQSRVNDVLRAYVEKSAA
jgi:hypothetical protein